MPNPNTDDQLVLTHLLDGQSEIFSLAALLTKGDAACNELIIGRSDNSPAPHIPLPHTRISRRQATLHHRADSGWWLTPQGQVPTQLNGQTLHPDQAVHLLPGATILIEPFELRFSSLQEPPAPALPLSEESLLGRVLYEVNEQYLAWNKTAAEKIHADNPCDHTRLRQQLDAFIREAVARLTDPALDLLTQLAVRRTLSLRLTTIDQSLDTTPIPASILDGELARLNERIAVTLGLRFERAQMKTGFRTLTTDLAAVFARFRRDFSRGLCLHAVTRLLQRDLWHQFTGLGPLEDFMHMESVTEIMVNSPEHIYIEEFGHLHDSGRRFCHLESLQAVMERILHKAGRRLDQSQPLVDARLPDGSRVNAVIDPVALGGPYLTIRKFGHRPLTLAQLLQPQPPQEPALSAAMARFMEICVRCRRNILVSGGTGTGKTTLLNVLSGFIADEERVITVEDTAELQLTARQVVRLQARPANVEDKGAITLQHLVGNSLRMRPDRIVVGECRRGAETQAMIAAMNTGHSGSMTTLHANSPVDALRRLENLFLEAVTMPVPAIRQQIAQALNLVVQIDRYPDHNRRISQIAEIVGFDEVRGEVIIEAIFVYRPDAPPERRFAFTGYMPGFLAPLLDTVEPDIFF